MRNKGFALITVISLMAIVSLVVTAGIVTTHMSQLTTLSTVRFQLAQEAADACLRRALDEVNATGICGNRTLNNQNLGINLNPGVQCSAQLIQSGRICFIRAVGQNSNARVHKTAILQAFYGMGLYTVRGGVNATYSGGLLTGCYYEPNNNCFVPAFIASAGTVNLGGTNPQNCPANNTNPTSGILGLPPIFTNAQFTDLTPLFFNVNCFASNFYRREERCNYGLTDAIVDTYALTYRDGLPDFTFSPHGEPVINPTLLSDLNNIANVQNQGPPNCRVRLSTGITINLADILNNTLLNTLLGGLLGQCQRLEIYTNHNLTLTGGPSPIPVFVYSGADITLSGVNGGTRGITNFGENLYNLNIYTLGTTTITANSTNFRLLTTNAVNVNTGLTVSNATIIQALRDANQNNDPASPQNLIVGDNGTGTLTLTDSKLITRQIRFGTLNAWRDLVYVYANACPECGRDSNTASINACRENNSRCGWFSQGNAFFGTDANRNIQDASGRPLVSLLINNNSVVRANNNFFGGIYFGQDVNYIWGFGAVVRGFLVRNFPSNLSLNIGFSQNTDFRFRLDAINNLRYDPNRQGFPGFWFVRRVDCVRELPTPGYMSIITRMTSW